MQVKDSLIGGLVVDFGDKSIDLSVASRVNKINSLLQGAVLSPLTPRPIFGNVC